MTTNYAFSATAVKSIQAAQKSLDATRESVRAKVAGIVIGEWRKAKSKDVSIAAFVKAYREAGATNDYSGGWAEAIVKADNKGGNKATAEAVVGQYLADAKAKNDAQAAKRKAAREGAETVSPADSKPRVIDYSQADADAVAKHIIALLINREDGKAILKAVNAKFTPVKA